MLKTPQCLHSRDINGHYGVPSRPLFPIPIIGADKQDPFIKQMWIWVPFLQHYWALHFSCHQVTDENVNVSPLQVKACLQTKPSVQQCMPLASWYNGDLTAVLNYLDSGGCWDHRTHFSHNQQSGYLHRAHEAFNHNTNTQICVCLLLTSCKFTFGVVFCKKSN